MKNKILFYVLSLTWGLPMTIIGVLAALVLIIAGYKPQRYHRCWYFLVGKSWGGVSLGPVFVIDDSNSSYVKTHEFGHSLQNCFFGPLMPIIVCIPSFVRYHYREWLVKSGRRDYDELSEYDSVWYEAQATRLGNQYIIFKTKEKH